MPEDVVHVGTQFTSNQLHTCIQWSPAEIQHTGTWLATVWPVISTNSILLLTLSYCAFIPARKNSTHVSKNVIIQLLTFDKCVRLKLHNLKLCNSGSVSSNVAMIETYYILHITVESLLIVSQQLPFRSLLLLCDTTIATETSNWNYPNLPCLQYQPTTYSFVSFIFAVYTQHLKSTAS